MLIIHGHPALWYLMLRLPGMGMDADTQIPKGQPLCFHIIQYSKFTTLDHSNARMILKGLVAPAL